jgi:hypothetical protein
LKEVKSKVEACEARAKEFASRARIAKCQFEIEANEAITREFRVAKINKM